MDNLETFNKVKIVPQECLKKIQGGRMNGKSDINPMWRIEKLTELYGPCGIGWKFTIDKQWLENGAKQEISAFTNISLYIKYNGEWSEAIQGTGGSAFVANEKSGLFTSDECFKMALTDALSVACKQLGFGADVYYGKNEGKYSNQDIKTTNNSEKLISESQGKLLYVKSKGKESIVIEFLKEKGYTTSKEIKSSEFNDVLKRLED